MAATTEGTHNYFFDGKSSSDVLFEDEQCIVYDEDDKRQAPVHFVIVPKKRLSSGGTSQDDEKLLGHLLLIAKETAINMGLDRSGYHVMIDENHRKQKLDGIHVFGRTLQHMLWPVGPGSRL